MQPHERFPTQKKNSPHTALALNAQLKYDAACVYILAISNNKDDNKKHWIYLQRSIQPSLNVNPQALVYPVAHLHWTTVLKKNPFNVVIPPIGSLITEKVMRHFKQFNLLRSHII